MCIHTKISSDCNMQGRGTYEVSFCSFVCMNLICVIKFSSHVLLFILKYNNLIVETSYTSHKKFYFN